MKFLITEAIVSDRHTEPKIWSIPQGAPMPAKYEDVTITISLTSSGDTRKFTDNMLRKEIMDRLKVMDATNLQYLKTKVLKK